ncbi:MAG: hypothetical protein IIZ61_03160, partial [Lachnospiraceae bacterium]|nr:hypothetical protein [Lachnospiraceae bacterium]
MSEAGSSEVARRKLFDEDSMFDSSEGFMEEEDQVFYGGAWETMRDHAFSRATWDAEKLSRYDENARKDIQKFFKDYKTRYRDADVDPELYTPYNNPEPLWNFEKLESPKLSYKDKKKKKGEMKAAMKRAKEREAFERSGQPFPNQGYLTNASEYSAYMKEVAERKIAPVPDYSRLYEDGFTAETDEYTYEDGTHALTFKKEDLYEKNYSPDMFDPTYFAENFASVMDEMQKLRDLVKYYSDDANAQDLSVFDTERLRVLTETLKLMEDCYDKALAVHSLVRNEEGRIGFRLIEPEQTKEELAKAQEALRKYALSEDDAITAKIEKRYIESMSTHFEQETKDMQDRYQEKITKTSVAEPFYAEETYRTLDRIVKATEMEENAERYGKNSHTIETTLNQYLDEANAMSVYERMGASCEKMLEELKKANGGSLDGLSPEDAAYLNVILRKQKSIEYELKLYKS